MDRIDWNLLKSFSYVVQEGSLSGAARALGSTQPTIGRHIEALEDHLECPLFIRSRDGLIPTEEALNLLPEVEAMTSSYGALLRRVTGSKSEEMGTVRVATSEIVGFELIPKVLQKFQHKYPGINIELSISNQFDNLLKRDADIAVRMSAPKQEALIAKKIGISQVGLFAHDSYVKKFGVPKCIEELKSYKMIGADRDPLFFEALKAYGVNLTRDDLAIRLDNQIVQEQLIRNGLGIGLMQVKIANRSTSLKQILRNELSIPLPIWIVMHEDNRSSRRIRLLFDTLVSELSSFFTD